MLILRQVILKQKHYNKYYDKYISYFVFITESYNYIIIKFFFQETLSQIFRVLIANFVNLLLQLNSYFIESFKNHNLLVNNTN